MEKKPNRTQQKHAEKMELAKRKLAAGLVSDKFPKVCDISIRLVYYGIMRNSAVMVRTVNVFPHSEAYFHMECITRDCTDGGFDLTPKITKLIEHRKTFEKGEMTCNGGGPVSVGHACISYEISVRYH